MTMAYTVKSQKSGDDYFLHQRDTALRGGRTQRIYFFSKRIQDGIVEALPEGMQVIENGRTGLPLLRRIRED
jgi:hypothetical protein